MIFTTVLEQIIILFILIIIGFILGKRNILTEKGAKSITDIVLIFVTPCVIIKSFFRPFDRGTLKEVLLSFLIAALVHIGFAVICFFIFRGKNISRRRVLRFGCVFSNCGYMSLPLQEAVLGETGLLYAASFVAIFNLFVWSYGIFEMSGDKKYISPKKLLVNPGIIGIVIGMLFFLTSTTPPTVIKEPIVYLASLNTPLPMLIIGYHLAQSDIKRALRDIGSFGAIAVRLILLPLLTLGILYLCGIRGDLLVSFAISASAPTAAITTMFSAKFNQDTNLSVNLVSLSTIISLITMPLIITLAKIIA